MAEQESRPVTVIEKQLANWVAMVVDPNSEIVLIVDDHSDFILVLQSFL